MHLLQLDLPVLQLLQELDCWLFAPYFFKFAVVLELDNLVVQFMSFIFNPLNGSANAVDALLDIAEVLFPQMVLLELAL